MSEIEAKEQETQKVVKNETPSQEKKTNDGKSKKKKNKREKMSGRGGLIVTEPVAGTRDFLPDEMRLRKWLFEQWHQIAKLYGFEEYDAPILEPEELYKRKGGEEIVEQMYNFLDKSELPVALRPEMTPSLARLILKQGKTLMLPVKWYSIPQCWRYETTTRGRKREHYQWNMDIWGIPDVTAEAELLGAITSFFKMVGFTNEHVRIKVSSRKVIQTVLDQLGVEKDQFVPTCIVIDKIDKLTREEIMEELTKKINLTEECANKILDSLNVKTVEELEEKIGSNHEAIKDLKKLFNLAYGYGYGDWLVFDAKIVRGLSYYTGIVFEAFAQQGELQRAICGGGRYDKILSTYGSKQDIPACGFGFGDCVIIELLADFGLLPSFKHKIDDIVIPFDESLRAEACGIANKLRESGRVVDILLKKARIKQAFNYADRIGATRAIFVAPDEYSKGFVRVKYLREDQFNENGEKEFDVSIKDLTSSIQ